MTSPSPTNFNNPPQPEIGSSDFDAVAYVNALLAYSAEGLNPAKSNLTEDADEAAIAAIRSTQIRLQITSEEITGEVEKAMEKLLGLAPKTTSEVERLERDAQTLKRSLKRLAEKVAAATTTTTTTSTSSPRHDINNHANSTPPPPTAVTNANVFKTLRDLDVIKTNLEACVAIAREAGRWSALAREVETLFAARNLSLVAAKLVEMRTGAELLAAMPDHRRRLDFLERMEQRLESVVRPGLLEALEKAKDGSDFEPLFDSVKVYERLGRGEALRKEFAAARGAALAERLAPELHSSSALPSQFARRNLNSFYRNLARHVREVEWPLCRRAFAGEAEERDGVATAATGTQEAVLAVCGVVSACLSTALPTEVLAEGLGFSLVGSAGQPTSTTPASMNRNAELGEEEEGRFMEPLFAFGEAARQLEDFIESLGTIVRVGPRGGTSEEDNVTGLEETGDEAAMEARRRAFEGMAHLACLPLGELSTRYEEVERVLLEREMRAAMEPLLSKSSDSPSSSSAVKDSGIDAVLEASPIQRLLEVLAMRETLEKVLEVAGAARARSCLPPRFLRGSRRTVARTFSRHAVFARHLFTSPAFDEALVGSSSATPGSSVDKEVATTQMRVLEIACGLTRRLTRSLRRLGSPSSPPPTSGGVARPWWTRIAELCEEGYDVGQHDGVSSSEEELEAGERIERFCSSARASLFSTLLRSPLTFLDQALIQAAATDGKAREEAGGVVCSDGVTRAVDGLYEWISLLSSSFEVLDESGGGVKDGVHEEAETDDEGARARLAICFVPRPEEAGGEERNKLIAVLAPHSTSSNVGGGSGGEAARGAEEEGEQEQDPVASHLESAYREYLLAHPPSEGGDPYSRRVSATWLERMARALATGYSLRVLTRKGPPLGMAACAQFASDCEYLERNLATLLLQNAKWDPILGTIRGVFAGEPSPFASLDRHRYLVDFKSRSGEEEEAETEVQGGAEKGGKRVRALCARVERVLGGQKSL